MEHERGIPETPTFAALSEQFSDLHDNVGGAVTAGHLDLGPDLWLSSDPEGHAAMTCQQSEEGFALHLEEGDSGKWACMGMRLPIETLKYGQYLGILIVVRSDDMVFFTPTLRYLHAGGRVVDVPTLTPVVLSGGQHEQLSHIPIDPGRLADASGCELNLFFHNNGFSADFLNIKPLLIL